MVDLTVDDGPNRTDPDDQIIASGGVQEDEEDDSLPEAADADSANITPAEDMENRLWRIAERTKLNGHTETKVLKFMPEDYRADVPKIRYENPVNEDRTETYAFDMPKNSEDRENDYVRFLNKYGLSVRTPKKIEGFKIEVEHGGDEDDRWTPVIPEAPGPDKSEVAKDTASDLVAATITSLQESKTVQGALSAAKVTFIIAAWPVAGLKICQVKYEEKKNDPVDAEIAESMGIFILGLVGFGIFWFGFSIIDASTVELLFESGSTASGNFMPVWGGL